MRIARLDLIAFGPFSDCSLDLAGAPMVLIHGPNEAGKSAALRALGDWLFGFPERTNDDFVHARDKLRVGGLLRDDDGHELAFVRRKGRKNTLLDPAGEVLSESELKPFLGNIERPLFESLFGIDHPRLVAGGQAMLEQHGDVGQALFSAALGGQGLHRLRAELDEEADALFRPRGSKQRLNQALRRYNELKRKLREHSLSARAWQELREARDQAEQRVGEIEEQRRALRADQHRLQRILAVLPRLARRHALRDELDALGEVRPLAGDFAARHAEARRQHDRAGTELQRLDAELTAARRQLERIQPDAALLQRAERIDALHAELGAVRKAARDRRALVATHDTHRSRAARLLGEIRPELELEAAGELRPLIGRARQLEVLVSEGAGLRESHARAEAQWKEASDRLRQAEEALAANPAPASEESLRDAIAGARRLGELDARIERLEAECKSKRQALNTDLARLRPAPPAAGQLVTLAPPSSATIERFAREFDAIESQRQRLNERIAELDGQRRDALRALDALQRDGEIPDQAMLTQARDHRDQLWRSLRGYLRDGAGEDPGDAVFEAAIRDADALADRRYREADRVRRRADLDATLEDLATRLADARERLVETQTRGERLAREWQAAWREVGIDAAPPAEMREWLGAFEQLRSDTLALDRLNEEAKQLTRSRANAIRALRAALSEHDCDVPDEHRLDAVLGRAERLAARLAEQATRHREQAQRQDDARAARERAGQAREQAREALAGWQRRWASRVAAFGLPADAGDAEASARVEALRGLFEALDAADELEQRIDAIDDDAGRFAEEVVDLVAAIDPTLAEASPTEAAAQLHRRLGEARQLASQRAEIERRVDEAEGHRATQRALRQGMERRLRELCREAGVTAIEDLDEAERRASEQRRLEQALREVDDELREIGDGRAPEQLCDEAAGHQDSDALRERLQELEERIEGLESERGELAERLGRVRSELAHLEDEGAAATAEQAASQLAAIRADVERYARLRLAAKLLRERVEAYRRDHQAPLLKRAGELFSHLTLGRFEGLGAAFDERDRPVLRGLRAGGGGIGIEAMSTGTRDQLYLALRLASLEHFLHNKATLPFIVDDVLIEFDDHRARAALEILADLSTRTQVILFTHHQRLVEQARALDADVRFIELDGAGA